MKWIILKMLLLSLRGKIYSIGGSCVFPFKKKPNLPSDRDGKQWVYYEIAGLPWKQCNLLFFMVCPFITC